MSDKYAFVDAEYAAACAPSIGRCAGGCRCRGLGITSGCTGR